MVGDLGRGKARDSTNGRDAVAPLPNGLQLALALALSLALN